MCVIIVLSVFKSKHFVLFICRCMTFYARCVIGYFTFILYSYFTNCYILDLELIYLRFVFVKCADSQEYDKSVLYRTCINPSLASDMRHLI